MVMPVLAPSVAGAGLAGSTDSAGEVEPLKQDGRRAGSSGGDGTGTRTSNDTSNGASSANLHPAISGLLQNLPTTDKPLSTKKRAALVAAFKATIDLVYGDENDG